MYHHIVKRKPSDIQLNSIRYGILMFTGLVAYFLLMYLLGLAQHSELRVFNGIIQIFYIYLTIRSFYILHPEHIHNYLLGVIQGIKVSVYGIVPFAIFVMLFLYFDPELMSKIKYQSLIGDYLNPFTSIIFILVEGLSIGLIISYLLTRIIEAKLNGNLN